MAIVDVSLLEPVRQAGFADPEVGRDLLELLARLAIAGDTNDVVTELFGVGLGHWEHSLAATGQDRKKAIALYQWNTEAFGAVYEAFHVFEVVLRNALDMELCSGT